MRFFEFYRFRDSVSSAQTARERLKRLVARDRILHCELADFPELRLDEVEETIPAPFQSQEAGLLLRHTG